MAPQLLIPRRGTEFFLYVVTFLFWIGGSEALVQTSDGLMESKGFRAVSAAVSVGATEVVVVDTDMGIDDVAAIALLLHEKTHIVGLVAVDGLAHVKEATQNLLRLTQQLQVVHIPVVTSQSQTIHDFPSQFREISERLPNITLPSHPSHSPVEVHATEFLLDVADACEQLNASLVLMCLGPLTNLAAAMKDPRGKTLPEKISRLVLMFGAVDVPGNNPTQAAEWNSYADSSAASYVLNGGRFSSKTEMAPLDVTRFSKPKDLVAAINRHRGQLHNETKAGTMLKECIMTVDELRYSFLYDPCAALFINSGTRNLLVTKNLVLKIHSSGTLEGQTYEISDDAVSGGTLTKVAYGLNVAKFEDMMAGVALN